MKNFQHVIDEVKLYELLIGALFGALGIVVPITFHWIGLGKAFLPMHLPILIGAFFVSPAVAASVGMLTPLASSFLTGMPPLPIALIMSLELAVLGMIASLSYKLFCKVIKREFIRIWFCVLVAVGFRVTIDLVLIAEVIAPILQLPSTVVGLAAVLSGLPGLILQVGIVPFVVLKIQMFTKGQFLWTRNC